MDNGAEIRIDGIAGEESHERPLEVAEMSRYLREAGLNPPDLIERVPEVVPGYPDRIIPVSRKRLRS